MFQPDCVPAVILSRITKADASTGQQSSHEATEAQCCCLLQHALLLSLEEMYHGCVKKVTHERQVTKSDGSCTTEQRELTIDVGPCLF